MTLCAHFHTVDEKKTKGAGEKRRFQKPFEGKILFRMTGIPVGR